MDSQNSTSPRKKLVTGLATVLRAVHSALIRSLKKRRETALGHELTPVEWFNLLSKNPEYQWMQAMTSLMSDIDALLDNREDVNENDFAIVRDAVSRLVSDDESLFKHRFFDEMAKDSELIIPHATLNRILEQWPKGHFEGDAQSERRQWHVGERRLAHMRAANKKNNSNL